MIGGKHQLKPENILLGYYNGTSCQGQERRPLHCWRGLFGLSVRTHMSLHLCFSID